MIYNDYFKKKNIYDVDIQFYENDIKKYPQIVEIIEQAKDRDEVAEKLFENRKNIITTLPPFFNEKTLDKTQFYAMAMLHADEYTDFFEKAVMTMARELNCKIIETDSDCASTKVGNENFKAYINNNCGDGLTINIIDENDEFNHSFFTFQGMIEGNDFNIYDYDCGEKPIHKLNGKYLTYSDNSIILFQKIK